MDIASIIAFYKDSKEIQVLQQLLSRSGSTPHVVCNGLIGSGRSVVASAMFANESPLQLFILNDKETAVYFFNDLENIAAERELSADLKHKVFFPLSYKRSSDVEDVDNANILLRAEVLNKIHQSPENLCVVTFPEALCEKVVNKKFFQTNTLHIQLKEILSIDFITELFETYNFERTDFVVEPGNFAVRGGIVDVFSFSNDYPYRIEFDGDTVISLRTFDPVKQTSLNRLPSVTIVPNIQKTFQTEVKQNFLETLPADTIVWCDDIALAAAKIKKEREKIETLCQRNEQSPLKQTPLDDLYCNDEDFLRSISRFATIEFATKPFFSNIQKIDFAQQPQPVFSKNFNLLIQNCEELQNQGYSNYILSDNPRQLTRLEAIIADVKGLSEGEGHTLFKSIPCALHEGFIDKQLQIACYTDHQIFERYHKYRLSESFKNKEAITIKEFFDLKPGDYVTHIDHGIARYGGLEKIEINGKLQESIRLIYKDNDILYISIHSLHRIAKYIGKDGTAPTLHRLGSNAWNNLKNKTKSKVKDIAKDLIKLYAERRASKGFAFSPDSYLQNELEASFIYEDTPDQVKATIDAKKDMEQDYPMDRLICGDVGFGKTEIAIRAAFKAICDSKQVAILVPTTILALQHYKTFSDRLNGLPGKVAYINRFKTSKEQKQIIEELENGKIDIIIGTHKILGKEIKFKDLGLLIIDEEHKFGVSAKEKLRQIKANVDTLTLTATPIPRTLQFSLMGARDLSIINTPPPNRYPVQTEIHMFEEDFIRDAIIYEVSRGGQVFFIHNRVQNIMDVAGIISRLCPDLKILIGHGQMEGAKLEQIMLDFIDGFCDVLVCTTIVESGLDVPNANTIFINDAHHYGLSDLHQLRGRVGRANKHAFCYLLAPPLITLTDEARKRLKAIEEFADLGSGFNIAMRDLDIRGAGNLLGAEQSGFITEIGYEMYQKILDEAIQELKDTEFKDIYNEEEMPIRQYVRDCTIETDLEILIPDDYVGNIKERLSLYKELDNTETEDALLRFQDNLIDRFGPIPPSVLALIDTIRLRWVAKDIGFEKIIMKNGQLTGYFVSNENSEFYQSSAFTKVLNFVKLHHKHCTMKEIKNKLTLSFGNIKNVQQALAQLRKILEDNQA